MSQTLVNINQKRPAKDYLYILYYIEMFYMILLELV